MTRQPPSPSGSGGCRPSRRNPLKIDTAVRMELDQPEAQPVAAECPVCFATVRKARLADHQQAAHGKAA